MTPTVKSPLISVILPIRNESVFIERSLKSLVSQTIPRSQFEVLVADGFSEDGTQDKLDLFQSNHAEFNLVVIKNPKKIFAAGFNLAYQKSQGQYIVMLGGHTCFSEDYLEKCISYLTDRTDIDCIGGVIDTIGETRTAKAIAAAMSSRFGVGGVAFRTGIKDLKETDTVAFGTYRKSVFEKSGLLDEDMVKNQDDEFNYRIRSHGSRIFIAPDIHADYYSRATLTALLKQYFLYGFWKVRVLQKWPGQMKLRHFVPAIFVLGLLFMPAAKLFSPIIMNISFVFIGSYLFCSIISSFLVSIKSRDLRILVILPLIFLILHFSYGFGFLVGCAYFIKNWRDLVIS